MNSMNGGIGAWLDCESHETFRCTDVPLSALAKKLQLILDEGVEYPLVSTFPCGPGQGMCVVLASTRFENGSFQTLKLPRKRDIKLIEGVLGPVRLCIAPDMDPYHSTRSECWACKSEVESYEAFECNNDGCLHFEEQICYKCRPDGKC